MGLVFVVLNKYSIVRPPTTKLLVSKCSWLIRAYSLLGAGSILAPATLH